MKCHITPQCLSSISLLHQHTKGGLTSGQKRPDKKVQKEADVSSQIRIF